MNTLEQKVTQIEHEMASAFNQGDIDAILKFFDGELVGFSSTKHERLHGQEAIRQTSSYYL